MKNVYLFIGLALFTFACGTKKLKGDGEGQVIVEKKASVMKLAVLGFSKIVADSLQKSTVLSATISGNVMTVKVQYPGGCADHRFELEGSTIIAKSLPAIRPVRLISIGVNDKCKALITKTLQFDISNLAYQKVSGSEIMLQIDGITEKVKYTYVLEKE